MKISKTLALGLLTSSLLVFSACSDSNNSKEEIVVDDEITLLNPITGYLVDAGVSGVNYECSPSGASGITDVNGTYICEDGENVEFQLCGQPLGSLASQEYITPAVIFPGDEEASLNLAQLLQSLDKDSDPSNGIELDTSLCSSFTEEISFTSPDFDEDIQKILTEHNITLVSEDNATQHLNDTFVTIDIDDDGTDRTYTWIEGEWGTCAGSCGTNNATQTRDVTCEDTIGTINESKCDADVKPGASQSCTASACPVTPTVPTNQAPVFTSSANQSIAEYNELEQNLLAPARALRGQNRYYEAFTLTATDPQNDDINFSISGGDSAYFDLNATSGVVRFENEEPDFESTKRNYVFTATVTDSKLASTTQDVNISITDEEDIEHNGTVYGSLVSSVTGELWLDRNLGASQACTALDDTACYGDYYQWGRDTDGHEKSNSPTGHTKATQINPVQEAILGFFVTSNTENPMGEDWVVDGVDNDGSSRRAYWSNTNGISVCPDGFRVPTIGELEAESISNRDDAFTKLKLPSAGYNFFGGFKYGEGSSGYLWSSSTNGSDAKYLDLSDGTGYNDTRMDGLSVRCIQDYNLE